MKRVITATVVVLLLYGTFGCSITGNLNRANTSAGLTQLTTVEREECVEKLPEQIITVVKDSVIFNLIPASVVDGERVGSIDIDAVTVVAKVRSLPERDGEVVIDFMVNIPKELLGRSSCIVITPYLHKLGKEQPLQELTIRGVTFDKLQRRDYWQYHTYRDKYPYDSLRIAEMFNRFVKFPYHVDPRLDSLSERRSHITYYYSQSVPTDQIEKKMLITLKGEVVGIDQSIYTMPASDTLTYLVSSMLSFVDHAPRYRVKIVDKYRTVNDRNYIQFLVNDTRLIDSLADNEMELDKITTLLTEIVEQEDFYVDTITLTATSSPEGWYSHNDLLAKRRAESLKSYLTKRCGDSINNMITVRWIAEDWQKLREVISSDSTILNREHILEIIDSEKNPDRRELKIRKSYPKEYQQIKKHLYPQLRGVNFKYDLRRVGMVKDTIHTTELDTTYLRGVELLQARKYAKALYILDGYNDRNAVIAHISMGHDKQALEILHTLPSVAVVEYLRAVVYSRLGRKAEGIKFFRNACALDPKMVFRANLDPEITELLKP